MDKRVLIFSPEIKDREEIAVVIDEYFKHNFGEYSDLYIQKYSSFCEPPTTNQLGHWGLSEIFVVMDRRLCPDKSRFVEIKFRNYYRGLRISLELSKKVCDEKDIPYIMYEGEITKKQDAKLKIKIDSHKNKIRDRLEEKIEQNLSANSF